MKYLFLYCPDTANGDATNYFGNKGYQTAALDKNPQTFWDWVTSVDQDGILVLLSHGDETGPLMVKGHNGKDMDADQIREFGAHLVQRNISLYLLSCETGKGAFAASLAATGATFIAPIGYAEFKSNSVGVAVHSRGDKNELLGWFSNGINAPRRNASPLVIPSGD
ncbi:hypothetical protein [Rhodanobacter terrae]|uniref:CHAT domain-containing protein n=1 Tax=Rhodanobacter terrae TaxID=418647 RepID=A0ABW0T396_9GAMM